MKAIREVHTDGWCVRLDLTRQVLRLEIPEPIADGHRGGRKPTGPSLVPVLSQPADGPVSAATLLLKAKQLDDRLYAAIELAAQHGAGRFTGKATLLRSLAATLATGLTDADLGAATMVHTACELGGVPVAVPEILADAVRSARAEFLCDERLSKPLGFYTWTPELSAVFRQGRFLQQPLEPDLADDLARALDRTPGASAAYGACLRLHARLTNPPKKPGLRDAGKSPPLFPSSRSHEVTLFEKLYEDRPIPEGFDLMGELIRRVRSGDIRLMPGEESGWYDHQAWSLEPLLVPDWTPESARLELGKRYREYMEDLFRGALALTRETHARQVGGGRGGYGPSRRPLVIHPDLTVEPLPTVFARRAAAYRFVRSVLEEAFGADALSSLRRLSSDGSSTPGLAEELVWIEKLFAGAAATASRELGMELPVGGENTARSFSAWRAKLRSDDDVSRDVRMMVPVYYDDQRRKTKVWAFLGWRTVEANAIYRVPPAVLTVEAEQPPGEPPPVLLLGERYELAVPVTAEVYVQRLLDRDEFRRHCDRFKTREAILANLC